MNGAPKQKCATCTAVLSTVQVQLHLHLVAMWLWYIFYLDLNSLVPRLLLGREKKRDIDIFIFLGQDPYAAIELRAVLLPNWLAPVFSKPRTSGFGLSSQVN
jgi:hypothetical protein